MAIHRRQNPLRIALVKVTGSTGNSNNVQVKNRDVTSAKEYAHLPQESSLPIHSMRNPPHELEDG